MALPKVNETLNFTMKIPSTGQRVKYRPYLVKEEKVLLQAFESGDVTTCLEAMVDTLGACLDPKDDVDVSTLATFDVEYMFTQVRSKSVGENSTIQIKCKECEEPNAYTLDLDTVEVGIDDQDKVIDITDSISVEMKYPTYSSFLDQRIESLSESDPETIFTILASSISAVLTNDERIDCAKEDPKSIIDFLNSMTASQLQSISKFMEDLPALKHLAEFDCEKCGTHNELELKGLSDFF